MVSALLAVGAAALGLSGAGCSRQAPPPLAPGVAPIDSSKPPPNMQALYQRTQAAKAGAGQPPGGTASP